MSKSAIGQRGKWAEKEVQKILDGLSRMHAEFDYERLPDARAARGAVKAQVADFAWFSPGKHGLVEVKETEHDFRLPRDKLAQLPRMRKRALAGGRVLVLVYHSQHMRWRAIPLAWFDGPIPPSWDLSNRPNFATAEEAFYSWWHAYVQV